jgi:hypothetical protein
VEIQGTLIGKLPLFKGTGARGNWVKQEFILETRESSYLRKVCISVFGDDKIRELESFSIGESIKVSVNIESREYNGRWYTELRAWRLEKVTAGPAVPNDLPPASAIMTDQDEGADDLPF